MLFNELEKLAIKYRIECLTSIYRAGTGHMGSAMSVMDILVALYHGRIEGQPIMDIKKDYIVLSKGQAAPALETVLNGINEARIGGQVVMNSAGGQGLSVALGMALALRTDALSARVYAILEDSELQDGQVWEAAMCAGHYKANNLIAIIDKNGLQADGRVKNILDVEPVHGKFMSCNWRVFHVADGHNFDELIDAFKKALYGDLHRDRPALIIANTIKGKGVPFAENNVSYQHTPLSKEEMDHTIPVLQERFEFLDAKLKGVL